MNHSVIFWDFDGTLIHSNQSFLCSLQEALHSYGFTPLEEQCRSFLKQACSWNHPEISYENLTEQNWWDTLLHKVDSFCMELGISPEIRPMICREFQDQVIRFPYTAYPDAEKILAYAKEKGFRNYILSNNFPELPTVANRLGMGAFLDGFFLSSCIGYEKPRAEIFQYAFTHTGSPSRCFMVGDNPIADIEGAQTAGIPTIWVHPDSRTCHADYICQSLNEIRSIL